MKKITKRDIIVFIIGLFTMLIIYTVCNWDDSVNSFKAGFKAGFQKGPIEIIK